MNIDAIAASPPPIAAGMSSRSRCTYTSPKNRYARRCTAFHPLASMCFFTDLNDVTPSKMSSTNRPIATTMPIMTLFLTPAPPIRGER